MLRMTVKPSDHSVALLLQDDEGQTDLFMGTKPGFKRNGFAFFWGSLIAVLGGLLGVGGAEYRLPVLIEFFGYKTLPAVIVNLVVSVVTVVFAFFFRARMVPHAEVLANLEVAAVLLPGTLAGVLIGVRFAAGAGERRLNRVVAAFLFSLGLIIIGHRFIAGIGTLALSAPARAAAGLAAGVVIGVFSGLLGVAGGELLIPVIVLVFARDIKLAGSLALVISAPTMIVGLARYRREGRLRELRRSRSLVTWMSLGSVAGAWAGSFLLAFTPGSFLYLLLGTILLVSAIKIYLSPPRK